MPESGTKIGAAFWSAWARNRPKIEVKKWQWLVGDKRSACRDVERSVAGSCLIVGVAVTLRPVGDLAASVSFAQRWSSRDVLWPVDELVANTVSLSQLWHLRDKFFSHPATPFAAVNSVLDHSSCPDSHGLLCRYPPPIHDLPSREAASVW